MHILTDVSDGRNVALGAIAVHIFLYFCKSRPRLQSTVQLFATAVSSLPRGDPTDEGYTESCRREVFALNGRGAGMRERWPRRKLCRQIGMCH